MFSRFPKTGNVPSVQIAAEWSGQQSEARSVKLEGLDHPKTLDFAALLQIELPTAIGHLELLWAFTAKKAPQGNIGKWPDGAIARACFWMGDPQRFIQSLLQARLIESNSEHRYIVHDWHEHAPRWVRAKLAKANLRFVSTASPTVVATADEDNDDDDGDDESIEPTAVPTAEPTSKSSQAKPSEEQAKRSGAASTAPAGKQPTPEGAMAIALRDLGVVVRSIDPVLHDWLRDGFTTQQATDAVGIARIRKPHPEAIPANYLDKILRERARPPPAAVKAVDRITWRPPPDEEPACTTPSSTPSSKH